MSTRHRLSRRNKRNPEVKKNRAKIKAHKKFGMTYRRWRRRGVAHMELHDAAKSAKANRARGRR